MYKITFILFASILTVSNGFSQVKTMATTDNKLTEKEKADGWKLLFDGTSATGWHTYGQPSASKAWSIHDGAFYLDAEAEKKLPDSEHGDLVTNDEYENFDLKLDWKIGVKGNSGVIFYIHEDTSKYDATYETGMEMQVLDNGSPTNLGHDDAKLYTHRAGDLYDLLASKEAAKPQGQWNHIEIISKNGKLDFYMNGVHSLSTTIWNTTWTKMIAISKFKQWPGFGTFKKGKISLQDHGEDVWFKNIRIKTL
jgi:hypothetical protein